MQSACHSVAHARRRFSGRQPGQGICNLRVHVTLILGTYPPREVGPERESGTISLASVTFLGPQAPWGWRLPAWIAFGASSHFRLRLTRDILRPTRIELDQCALGASLDARMNRYHENSIPRLRKRGSRAKDHRFFSVGQPRTWCTPHIWVAHLLGPKMAQRLSAWFP